MDAVADLATTRQARGQLTARAGESIKALSEYLGHHDPGYTLRTYTHLMPSSETRTRAAVDRVLGGEGRTDDGLDTAQSAG
jgi:integrase